MKGLVFTSYHLLQCRVGWRIIQDKKESVFKEKKISSKFTLKFEMFFCLLATFRRKLDFLNRYFHKNKNDNIHKNEVQNIGFGIPIEFLSQRKKIFKSVQKHGIWLLWSRQSLGESTISNLESPLNFQVKEEEKIIEFGQETTKLC